MDLETRAWAADMERWHMLAGVPSKAAIAAELAQLPRQGRRIRWMSRGRGEQTALQRPPTALHATKDLRRTP